MILSSCSSDDDDSFNFVIGEWRAIEMSENNESVELPVCLQHQYILFKSNNEFSGGRIESTNYPDECYTISFSSIEWEYLGNNKYRIGDRNEQGKIYTIIKVGNNISMLNPNGITKIIYEPFESGF
ncbi:hypothetical protein BTO15_11415 [Polaribacter sejongensis]|uniref:Lipocalin-like domain-containing protein n=2 Tax=Polaribacter sejongensis TaxID=985043 RepID=A0ABM6Q109_9FLAO|nr:hypothetical protein BTO15_11415 [Polaribacter sejongensis]